MQMFNLRNVSWAPLHLMLLEQMQTLLINYLFVNTVCHKYPSDVLKGSHANR